MLEALKRNTIAAPLFDLRLVSGSKDISEVKRPVPPAPECVASIVMHEGIRQYTEGRIYKMPDGRLVALPRKECRGVYYDYDKAIIFSPDNPALVKELQGKKGGESVVLDIADVGSNWGSTPVDEIDVALLKDKIEPGLQKVRELLKADGINHG